MGSPCSLRWDDDWIAAVNAAETKAERRICGARTSADTPCTLPPNRQNGRCRFHGGFDLTGAQPGNRNAIIHGLYSRALQSCGRHFAVWTTCTLSGQDVLNLPQSEVPACPYEATLYQVAVSDALARLDTHARTDPMHRHIVQQTALLSVMVQRAAVAMGEHQMVDTSVTPEDQAALDTTRRVAHTRAQSLINNAEDDRRRGNNTRAKNQVEAAIKLAPDVADALKDPNAMDPFPRLAKLFEGEGEGPAEPRQPAEPP